MTDFSPTLRAELLKLDDTQIFVLLGEILEPSQGGPITTSENFSEAASPIVDVYCAAYDSFIFATDPDYYAQFAAERRDDARADEGVQRYKSECEA